MVETLKEKTAKGLFWGAMNSGTTQVLNIIFGIFMGRLLSPAETGIVGVLTIFTLIAGNIQSSGFTQGLINLKKPTDNDYNSVFWFNIIASISIYTLLFFCAPLIADFFHQPCLVKVSRFVFLAFVISSLGIVQNAYMAKNMMNKEIAICGFVALSFSGIIGLIMAFYGMSYWSLAWQQIIYISVLNICRYYYTGWYPNMHIDFTPVKKMFNFSVKILFTNIINTISNNMLTFIFGRLYTIHDVGNYNQAYNWDTKANSFVANTIGQIAQPVLASIRDDKDRAKQVFRKMMRFTAFLSFPLMFGLVLVGKEFILITIKDKWIDCIPLLQILCISGAFVPFYTLYQNLAISNGRSDIYLRCNIIQVAMLIALVIGCHSQGMTFLVTVYSAFTILWLIVWHIVTQKILGIKLTEIIKDTLPFLVIAAAVMGVTYFITMSIENLYLLFATRIIIAGILYLAIMRMAHVEILNECINFIRKKK